MKDWIKKPLEYWRGLEEHNRLAILLILIALLGLFVAWPVITGAR